VTRYATTTDLTRLGLPSAALSGVATETQEDALDAASSLADGYLSSRFGLPLSAWADFLRGFVQAAPDLSEAQVAQRAALYLGAVRATYYGARFPGLPSYPGDGQTACRTNCRCQLAY
jgi:hypothetical protein